MSGRRRADRKYPRHAANRDHSLAIGAGVTAVLILFLAGVFILSAIAKGDPLADALAAGVIL